MSRIGLTLCLALVLTSCREQTNDQQRLTYENGKAKPIVALVPMIDSTIHDLPWNLGDELTLSIHERLLHDDSLYLVDEQKVVNLVKKLQQTDNPFGEDIAWTKNIFSQNEFVVFMELLEHEETPVQSAKAGSAQDASAELNVSVRVRVIDMRGKTPKIVLQELIHDTHHIPRQFTKANFYQIPWGKESFNISPMGLAHAQLSKEIASRLEDYILLAMRR